MVSIGFLELCLSPRVAMDRSQKLINTFVSETKESPVFVYVLYYCCGLVCLVLWHINICRLFNAKSIFMQIVSPISNNSAQHEYAVELSKYFYFKLSSLVKQF